MSKQSPYETGELSDAMSLILASASRCMYGFQIMNMIRERTQGSICIGPGTMYRILKNMVEVGWLIDNAVDETRIIYSITDLGREVLARDIKRRKQLLDLVDDCFCDRGDEKDVKV